VYLAHTSNDAIDVIDTRQDKYLRSVPHLPGVAGVLVSNEKDLVFTSNRGEKTVGMFQQGMETNLEKVTVGGFPNGLAFDDSREHLLAANVSKPEDPVNVTISMVDVKRRIMISDLGVLGRTRWTVYDKAQDRFYVNIAKPSKVIVVKGDDPNKIEFSYDIPANGPHGLDVDVKGDRLFCACDEGGVYQVDLRTNSVRRVSDLSGPPDVIFYNSELEHLYVAIGDPGVIDVIDAMSMRRLQTARTEPGTHTLAFNPDTNKVYAFMPESHRASAYLDE